MQFKKDPNIRYTQMCQWIDANMQYINDEDCPEEISEKIYNYLWLLVKALAIKARMFKDFDDYDGYAFYSATHLYMSMKNNLKNAGTVVKGREIKPIKSILNYTKALMYGMKVDYLREERNIVLSSKNIGKDYESMTSVYKRYATNDIWRKQGGLDFFEREARLFLTQFDTTLDLVLKKAPFPKGSPDYKKLRMSLLLNVAYNVQHNRGLGDVPPQVVLWKMPKSMSSYVKIFIVELGTYMRQALASIKDDWSIEDEDILTYMISNPNGDYLKNEEF